MIIYINGRFLTQSVTGVQRYAIEVVKGLDKLLQEDKINKSNYKLVILTPSNIINNLDLKHIEIKKIGSLSGHLWEQLELPLFVKNEALLNLCNAGPIFRKRQLTVIHDVAVFANKENFSFLFRIWYKILLKSQSIFSKKIVTVSNFSKDELIRFLKPYEGKINVIYEGKEHFTNLDIDKSIIKLNNLDEKPYVLAVSSLNPNKNFGAIVDAIKLMETDNINIVIAGGTDPKVFSKKGTKLPDNIIHLGYVSDSELKALYKNAFCFIYPSLYEGFGLPPLEAMSIGCPIIISDKASLPEVGGDAALYCDPYCPQSIANKISELQQSASLREKVISKGKEQAERFTWIKCSQELFNLMVTTFANKERRKSL